MCGRDKKGSGTVNESVSREGARDKTSDGDENRNEGHDFGVQNVKCFSLLPWAAIRCEVKAEGTSSYGVTVRERNWGREALRNVSMIGPLGNDINFRERRDGSTNGGGGVGGGVINWCADKFGNSTSSSCNPGPIISNRSRLFATWSSDKNGISGSKYEGNIGAHSRPFNTLRHSMPSFEANAEKLLRLNLIVLFTTSWERKGKSGKRSTRRWSITSRSAGV